jgi:hypothetical protein
MHRLKVKFARIGAMATCPSCKQKFAVDQNNLMAIQESASGKTGSLVAAPGAAAAPTPRAATPTPAQNAAEAPRRPVRRPAAPPSPSVPQHAAKSSAPGAGRPHVEGVQPAAPKLPQPPEQPDELAALSKATTKKVVKKKKKGGLSVKLVAMLLIIAISLGVTLAAVIYITKHPDIVEHTVRVDKDGRPIAAKPDDPATKVHTTPPPTTTTTNAKAVAPTEAPKKKQPKKVEAAAAAVVNLEPLPLGVSQWSAIEPPAAPLTPLNMKDATLWSPRLQRDPDSDRTVFTVTFADNDDKTYEQGYLQVQLVDASQRAFAEFKQPIPAITGRTGLEIRLAVPKELAAKAKGVVADLTPLDPIDKTAPIQMDESKIQLVGGTSESPVLEVAVYNPNGFPVMNATVVVQVLGDDGYVLGSYRGNIPGRIAPHKAATFRIEPKLEENSPAGRVVVRGFAVRAN